MNYSIADIDEVFAMRSKYMYVRRAVFFFCYVLLVALVVSAHCNDGARVRMIVEVAHLIYTPAWCVFNTPYVSVSRHSRSSRHSSARKPSKPGSHTRRGRPSSVRKPLYPFSLLDTSYDSVDSFDDMIAPCTSRETRPFSLFDDPDLRVI